MKFVVASAKPSNAGCVFHGSSPISLRNFMMGFTQTTPFVLLVYVNRETFYLGNYLSTEKYLITHEQR